VYAVDSIIISIISLTGFVLNYYFQWVPVNFMIWAMITLAPVLLFGVHRIFS
jgi:accessory gene regulator protein AgrB